MKRKLIPTAAFEEACYKHGGYKAPRVADAEYMAEVESARAALEQHVTELVAQVIEAAVINADNAKRTHLEVDDLQVAKRQVKLLSKK